MLASKAQSCTIPKVWAVRDPDLACLCRWWGDGHDDASVTVGAGLSSCQALCLQSLLRPKSICQVEIYTHTLWWRR